MSLSEASPLSDSEALAPDIAECITGVVAAPTDAMAQFDLGFAYLKLSMFAHAIAPLRAACELKPQWVSAHINLTVALTESGDGYTGEVAARAALALDPANNLVYFCLGNALRRQGRPQEAVEMFIKHLELYPGDLMARCNLGLAWGDAGHDDRALSEFRTVLASNPRDFKALHGSGIALAQSGDLDGAIAMLERACDVDGTDISAWEYLGNYFAKRERLGEALLAFDRILALEPNSFYANYNKAAVLFKLGRPDLARPYSRFALEIAPNNELAKELAEALAE